MNSRCVYFRQCILPLMPNPAAHYHRRLTLHQNALERVQRNSRLVSRLRLLSVLSALVLAIYAFRSGALWQWIAAMVCAIAFLILVRIYTQMENQLHLLQLRIGLLKDELEGLGGNYSGFPKGEAYIDTAHPYSFDLDLFGAGSIYQMLCRSVTHNGAQALASMLQTPKLNEGSMLEQQAMIQELSANPEFPEDFRAEGMMTSEEASDYQQVLSWLSGTDQFINNIIAKMAMILLPLTITGLIVYSIINGAVKPGLGLAVMANWIVLGAFGKKIKAANLQIGRTARLVEKYQRLQMVTASHQFLHPQLAAISTDAQKSTAQISRFRKLANMFDSRNNGMTGPLMNSLFLFDIYCLLQLERWRKVHKSLLVQNMESMVLLDVLVSLANYAFNHPDNAYPTFNQEGMRAKNLRHPLLIKDTVGNDCSIGIHEKIYLLTGANMTGKSTFIRTIGVAAVLSYTGLPVTADELSLPLMHIYTAIRITDSIQNDVSYFRAELNRIKAIMDTVQSGELFLVLLDEPLRGTNSGDKQQGTRSIIEKLLQQNVIGIVATHDIGLCALQEEYPGRISNYHFESTVTPDGLDFDFKLKTGGSTSNNATILMRQMGIIS